MVKKKIPPTAGAPNKILAQFIGAHKFGSVCTLTRTSKWGVSLVFPVPREKWIGERLGTQIKKSNIGTGNKYSIKSISEQ